MYRTVIRRKSKDSLCSCVGGDRRITPQLGWLVCVGSTARDTPLRHLGNQKQDGCVTQLDLELRYL